MNMIEKTLEIDGVTFTVYYFQLTVEEVVEQTCQQEAEVGCKGGLKFEKVCLGESEVNLAPYLADEFLTFICHKIVQELADEFLTFICHTIVQELVVESLVANEQVTTIQ